MLPTEGDVRIGDYLVRQHPEQIKNALLQPKQKGFFLHQTKICLKLPIKRPFDTHFYFYSQFAFLRLPLYAIQHHFYFSRTIPYGVQRYFVIAN
jgi:hypothetical protein